MIKNIMLSVLLLMIAVGGYWWLTNESKPNENQPAKFERSEKAEKTAAPSNTQASDSLKAGSDSKEANETNASSEKTAQSDLKPTDQPRRTNAARDLRQSVGGSSGRRGGGSSAQVKAATQVQGMAIEFGRYQPEQAMLVSIHSRQDSNLTAPASSTVEQILVKNGDRVKQGQTLVVLASDDLVLALAQQRSSLVQQQSQNSLANNQYQADLKNLTQAKKDYAKEQSLSKKGLSSETALTSKQQALDAAQLRVNNFSDEQKSRDAQLSLAQLQFDNIQEDVNDLTITAPFDADIVALDIAKNERLNAGQVVVQLIDKSSLYAKGQIPLSLYHEVKNMDISASRESNTEADVWPMASLGKQSQLGVVEIEFDIPTGKNDVLIIGEVIDVRLQLEAIASVRVPSEVVYFNQQIYLIENATLAATDIEILGYQQDQGNEFVLLSPSAFSEDALKGAMKAKAKARMKGKGKRGKGQRGGRGGRGERPDNAGQGQRGERPDNAGQGQRGENNTAQSDDSDTPILILTTRLNSPTTGQAVKVVESE